MKKLSKRNDQVSNTVMAFAGCPCNYAQCYIQCKGNSQVQDMNLNGLYSSILATW
ncbi:putative bacteriocin precursor, CLI_3235 family [Clostridium sp. BNL1100]|nr:putative bacteriocin precursor, CLI_3235 family [Clostridium sp. BNL1100]